MARHSVVLGRSDLSSHSGVSQGIQHCGSIAGNAEVISFIHTSKICVYVCMCTCLLCVCTRIVCVYVVCVCVRALCVVCVHMYTSAFRYMHVCM